VPAKFIKWIWAGGRSKAEGAGAAAGGGGGALHHLLSYCLDLPRFGGEPFAPSRPAISNFAGLWYPSDEWRLTGL
jgi:hypothetical protein